MSLRYSEYRRPVLVVLALALIGPLSAQMPFMKANGKEDGNVYLQKLAVNVSIAGSLATTTWTMTFHNKTHRILEGELNFPLPAGISVSRYALDINGRMREAVPVTKEKATILFETVERRRVDPGILEKVEGNTFRTRIYPINPDGERTVLIAYEQDLAGDNRNELRYSVPLSFSYRLEVFSLDISVVHSAARPLLEQNGDDNLQFSEWNDIWSASHRWENYQADHSLTVLIPKPAGAAEAMMQPVGNHYFFAASVFLQPKKIERPLPGRLTILWDASLSGLTSHGKKELDLLDAYFARLRNEEITLVKFSNTSQTPKKFSVVDGAWSALRSELENTTYDGATQFGALDLNEYPGDGYLLFSDGHSTFGADNIRLSDRPVYAIVSEAGADFPFLQSIANRTSGDLINLDNMTVQHARDELLYQKLEFLGIKPVQGVEDCYPSPHTQVTGSFTVTGISFLSKAGIVLQFGYGGKPVLEVPVSLDISRQQTDKTDLARVWAQKKIAELDTRYEDNRAEIEQLGRKYSIVTRNTSLIVLESVNDYVTYEVEPPAELRTEYDRIIKERRANNFQARQEAVNNAETYFNELLDWWRRPVPQVARYAAPMLASGNVRADQALAGRVSGVTITARGQASQDVVVSGVGVKRKSIGAEKADDEDRGTFTAAAADDNTDYLRQLRASGAAERYGVYLQLRRSHLHTPVFYFRAADVFFKAGQKTLGIMIVSNIAELETENYELYKMLGYKLKEQGETAAECDVFRRIIAWRPFEPQSYRDFGLALEDAGRYQQALDTLCYAITRNYDEAVRNLYQGIEETLIPEINALIAKKGEKLDISRVPKMIITNMPVDIRVVVNWNRPNTDIDLWVTDPNGEKCYYSHRLTEAGGRISTDFTRGLGPEQFLLRKAVRGTYKVEVNYYGDTQVALAGGTTIMAEVYTNYGTERQTRRVITLQMQRGGGGAVFVGQFDFK